jgi:CBS domain containing-hemolysin-like protein
MLNARIFTFLVLLAIIPCASASSMGGGVESEGTYSEPSDLIPLAGFLFLALFFSFLCSTLEAVILSVTDGHIQVMISEKTRGGELLRTLKTDVDRSLAAILSVNTVAHTAGAAGVGAEVAGVFGSAYLGIASVILTLLILVLSEIIPKTLGATYWKSLAPTSAVIIKWLIFFTYPLVLVLEIFSRLVAPSGHKISFSRSELIAMAEVAEREGIVESDESRIVKNALRLKDIAVKDVMTPVTVMFTFQSDESIAKIVEKHKTIRFSRIPVKGKDLNDIKGYVLRREVLRNAADGKKGKISDIIRPVHKVDSKTNLDDAFDEFTSRKDMMFIVVNEFGATEGLISMEDAVEALLGVKFVDEMDEISDMRELAKEKWKSDSGA